ncbi:MAG: hypothetical protein IJZ61_08950 [Oscillospiraceae bacterium]|nr:hypothetical protein [Oscillospiraceae bacterium]
MVRFRKTLSIILPFVIIITICTSCNAKNGSFLTHTPDMNSQYEAEMKICSGDLEFSGTVKRYGAEFWEMSVDSPETLAGLTLSMNSEGVKANLGELVLDIPIKDVRDSATFALIFKALDNAAVNKLSCTDTEDGMIYEGEFSGTVYRLTFNPETLEPVLLEIPEAGLSAEFAGFEILGTEAEMENTSQTTAETD